MSRTKRGENSGQGWEDNHGRSALASGSMVPWLFAGVLGLALVGIWLGAVPGRGSHHPDPRPGVTGETVVPSARYANYPRVEAAYMQAAEIAAVLDGLYCYCDCARHSGHRSLLTCFESDHAAACDVCMSEASVAHKMTMDGRSLDEVREAIDGFYGS